MRINKHLLFITISFLSLSAYAQTSKKTLNYQAVILDPKAIDIPGASITGQPLNKGNVCLRFSLLNAQGGLDYEETQQVTTDEYGLVSVAIGAGAQAQASNSTSIYKSFDSVLWNSSVKSLKVSVSYDGCNSFKQVSSQALNYTPYALYAEAVDYKNVREAPTKLSQFSNDAGYLIPKDLDPLKTDIKTNSSQIETANQTIADNKKTSDLAFLVVNQSISSLDKQVAENTNSITTINTKLTDQQNQITSTNNTMNAQIGGLQGQINTTNNTVSNLTGVAEMQSNKSKAVDLGGSNPSDQAYPSQKAAKAYVDQIISQIATTGVPDATTLAAGKLQLAGDLGGTATNPTVPALATKENSSNKSTAINLGAGNPSDQLFPSQKATKTYVDNAIYDAVGTGVPDATTVAAGKLKLAGDLAGTANAPTVPGLSLKEDISNKSNAALSASTTLYPTQNAVKTYVDAQIANATIADADATTRGKIQLTGGLGGTASAPTVPGLLLKEDLTNKSTAADLGATLASDAKYPTQNAVKTYVDNKIANATIADASAINKGKLQLAGDLAGTAAEPLIADGVITSAKIQDRTIATNDIADLAITDGKIGGIAGSKVTGNIAGNAANVNGTIAVGNGGTGATGLTGYVKGNGTDAMSTVSAIPVADVSGAVRKVNGSLPNSSGEVSILFGRVTSGNFTNVPTSGGVNGDIYIVSGDGNASNNGRTFIKDDATWNEVSPNTAATDARYLQLAGGTMDGSLTFPTGKVLILTDAPTGSTDAANKGYVDAKISTEVPNASTTTVGKIKLAGDLSGTYDSPTVTGLSAKAPINNPTFTGSVGGISKSMVGLGNVENTSDANKPVSDATATALSLKAPIASPAFTGTVSGISKSMVGLGNVDNTSDASKPVSDATATALGAKENSANKSTAIDLGATNASNDKYPSQLAVKTYVDASVTSGAPDADGSTKGKIQLAGDLAGTSSSASAPIISNLAISTAKLAADAVTSAKILDGEIVNADISATAAIADSKLATIVTSGKVSNSATTATDANTASAIVARDGSGNFTAGTITANLTGLASKTTNINGGAIGAIPYQSAANTTTLLTGNTAATKKFLTQTGDGSAAAAPVWEGVAVSDITGTLPVASGGTGVTTTAANLVFAGPTSGATPAAPSFRALVAADLPTGSTNYVNNGTTQQANTSFNISGAGTVGTTFDVTGNTTIGGTATITGATKISSLTASKGVFTDASKNLTSTGTLGTDQGGTGLASFNNGGAMYATSTSALTTGTLPTTAGGTGLTSYSSGGALYTTSTTAITSGTLPISAGGTGATSASANVIFAGPASGAAAAPSFRGLVAADVPSGSSNYINNTSTQQTANFNISGSGSMATNLSVGGTAIITGATTLSALTASKPVFTDANKQLTSTGTLGVTNGGTGLTSSPTNGQILIGNGTGFTLANLSPGTGITITNSNGSISIAAAVRPTTDQFSATANQLTFTLTQTPLTNANSLDNVWMFINGVRTNNLAYSVSGTTVTYVPGSNGSYALLAGDRIQFDYAY
jgi:hypothetical protein